MNRFLFALVAIVFSIGLMTTTDSSPPVATTEVIQMHSMAVMPSTTIEKNLAVCPSTTIEKTFAGSVQFRHKAVANAVNLRQRSQMLTNSIYFRHTTVAGSVMLHKHSSPAGLEVHLRTQNLAEKIVFRAKTMQFAEGVILLTVSRNLT